MAHDGCARDINPVHTVGDGDIILFIATGLISIPADESAIVNISATVMELGLVD